MIETLFATDGPADWPGHLERLGERRRPEPFDRRAMRLVGELSRRLLTSQIGRHYPELAALGHWFRPANLTRMKQEQQGGLSSQVLRPRGGVFIIAPANVDVLFIYGWLLSLLSGNVTVIRVSQRPSPIRQAFFGLIEEMAEDEEHRQVLASSAVISYPHGQEITRTLSSWCDLRLIWGGDATIQTIRSIPLKPTAVEGAFADRFSLAAFSAGSILSLEDAAAAKLARRFANDTMWLGQQACSSPRIVFWVGTSEEIERAKSRFWPLFSGAAGIFENEPAALMSRLSDLFVMAAEGLIDAVPGGLAAMPARAEGIRFGPQVRDLHSGLGLFIEYAVEQLETVSDFLSDKDQTLVAHGFDDADIGALVERLPNRSLDRIVRIGQATDFATSWDGINLFELLTRRVSISRAA